MSSHTPASSRVHARALSRLQQITARLARAVARPPAPSPCCAPPSHKRPFQLIFDPTRTGKKRRQMMVCFERVVEEAEINDFDFHDLRHTFAIRRRAANVHEYDIADLSGPRRRRGD